jgi:hypothetical protein
MDAAIQSRPMIAALRYALYNKSWNVEAGAAERNRTSDPVLTKDVLYP